MREVKFRGRRIDNGEWVHGFVHIIDTLGNGYTGKAIQIQNGNSRPFSVQVDESTIGEYTGIKDINELEIFEGDILRFPAKDYSEEKNFIGYEVFYHDNDSADRHVGFQMNRLHFYGNLCGGECRGQMLPNVTARMEIISNIYEQGDSK